MDSTKNSEIAEVNSYVGTKRKWQEVFEDDMHDHIKAIRSQTYHFKLLFQATTKVCSRSVYNMQCNDRDAESQLVDLQENLQLMEKASDDFFKQISQSLKSMRDANDYLCDDRDQSKNESTSTA